MSSFYYKSGELYCENVNLSDVAAQFYTPAYVYSKEKIKSNKKAYVESYAKKQNLAWLSVKSLNNISILKIIKDSGSGFDIVAGGELHRVLSGGADPKTIIFSGVGKSKDEIKEGILNKILSFNVESASEL